MNVLLTGHLGYVGTVMAPMLKAQGHSVTGLDSDLYQACNFGEQPKQFPTVHTDIRDISPVMLKGFDAVIHLAGLSNDPLGELDPELTHEINYRATVRLGRMAKEAGVSRFLFSSTCSVYGAAGESMLDEGAPLNPVTPYADSKLRAEQDLVRMADDDFSPTFLRSATAHGVSPRLRFDLVINNLTARAVASGSVFLKSDGTAWRPVVHIEDMSRAFLAVLNAPRELVHCQVFNVGQTSENYRVRDLADIVKDAVPGSRVEFSAGGGRDERCYRVDCSKISQTLSEYQPQWTAERGVHQLFDALQSNNISVDDVEGRRYKRVDHIRWRIAEGWLRPDLRWAN